MTSTTSSRAIVYLTERVEDATEAVKGLLGGNAASTSKYIDTSDDLVRAQLESDRDDVRLEGLKTVVSLISKGRDGSAYFASVVKLSSNANLEIRKLVYTIVKRYARRQPDIAMLGINSFQRDLQDRNEAVRAMALRVLTGLRSKLATNVVELAITKCVRDSSFYVRRAAAFAIIKCVDVSSEGRSAAIDNIETLLNDRNPTVLGASLVAWNEICPDRLDLLHRNYRKLCYALADMDEWSQREAIQILGLYAKRCLPDASLGLIDRDLQLLLLKVEDLLCSTNSVVVTSAARLIYALAPKDRHSVIARPIVRLTQRSTADASFLALQSCKWLSMHSPELLMPHIYDFIPYSSTRETSDSTRLKMQILTNLSDKETFPFVLSELLEQARHNPNEFIAATAIEEIGIWAEKCNDEQRMICVRQILALLRERRMREQIASQVLLVLEKLIDLSSDHLAGPVITRITPMLFPIESDRGKKKSAKSSGIAQSSIARATIYWLIGQYCQTELTVKRQQPDEPSTKISIAVAIGLDVLRKAAMNFAKEESIAKMQIIALATKLATFLPTLQGIDPQVISRVDLLQKYVFQLARYDEQFDVRDRARFCKALLDRLELDGKSDENVAVDDEHLGGVILRRNQVLHILFARKHSKGEVRAPEMANDWNILAMTIGQRAASTLLNRLPDFFTEPWMEKEKLPPASVRDVDLQSEKRDATTAAAIVNSKDATIDEYNSRIDEVQIPDVTQGTSKYRDLDDFLDQESEDEVESESQGVNLPTVLTNGDALANVEESDSEEDSESTDDDDEEEADSLEDPKVQDDSDDDGENAALASRSPNLAHRETPSISFIEEDNAWAKE